MILVKRIKKVGPGALVAAAFIGPGTVTTSSLAGANFGYTLIWALVFATLATIVLQEMSARLGTVGRVGLGDAVRQAFAHTAWRWPAFAVIITAIYVGNIAYEAGNLSGAALGIQAALSTQSTGNATLTSHLYVAGIGALAALLLSLGNYRQIERALLALVALMALAFVTTAVVVRPDLTAIFQGALAPSIPTGSLITVVALIGTTIVPYNLFLHASAAKDRYRSRDELADARFDTAISIGLGGLIAISIVTTAAASAFGSGSAINDATDMAAQLEPVFGAGAKYLLSFGLFAAGLSSGIAAPLAAGYVISELLGWHPDHDRRKINAVRLSVIASGVGFALTGIKPIAIIVTAQFANGLLLPFIVAFLLYVMNQSTHLENHVNGRAANLLGALILVVTTGLGMRLVIGALGA